MPKLNLKKNKPKQTSKGTATFTVTFQGSIAVEEVESVLCDYYGEPVAFNGVTEENFIGFMETMIDDQSPLNMLDELALIREDSLTNIEVTYTPGENNNG